MGFVKNSVYLLFVVFIFSSQWVFEYKNTFFNEEDFYRYLPQKDWTEIVDSSQKEKVFNAFVQTSVAVYEAKALGLDLNPKVGDQLRERFDRLLVNEYYMGPFLLSVLPDGVLNFAKQNLNKDVFVRHLLIKEKPNKKGEQLAFSLLDSLRGGAVFKDFVNLYSDDPSSTKNEGVLGWISFGQTVPSFQDVIFDLCVGCGGYAKTDFGHHVVFVDSVKASAFSLLGDEEYSQLAFRFATNYIDVPLKGVAESHDSLLLEEFGVVFNVAVLESFIDSVKNSLVLSGGSRAKVDFVGMLQNLDEVVAKYNGNLLSGVWFAKKLSSGLYNNVFFDSVDRLIQEFRLILLRDIVKSLSLEKGVDSSFSFKRQFFSIEQEFLKKEFLNYLLNSVVPPSKKEVEDFYYKNEQALFTNKDTGEPFGLKNAAGSVEAILLKNKQDEIKSNFFNSLLAGSVKINTGWLYDD